MALETEINLLPSGREADVDHMWQVVKRTVVRQPFLKRF